MPVSDLPQALTTHAVDGALIPWEIIPALKLQDSTKYQIEGEDNWRLGTTTFQVSMNKARWESLPDDLKTVFEERGGLRIQHGLSCGKAGDGAWLDKADDPALGRFSEALCDLMRDLAMQVIKDGEGISKLITVHVEGAETDAAAKRIALSIANSPLVKTAIAGEDANWGRVVMAIGKAGATNAGLLAASVLALSDKALAKRLEAWREKQTAGVAITPKDDA